jgi:mono/diheme cytochrome c family protein
LTSIKAQAGFRMPTREVAEIRRNAMRRAMHHLTAIALVGLPAAAAAQDVALGRVEFMANCAQCHGTEGRGDGIIANYLNVVPSDLTTLARDNGGRLPQDRLYRTIAGGTETGPHGTREMPAWGDRYSVGAAQAYGFTYTPDEQAEFIHRHILALIAYIDSIQLE